jgi:hypothetical protein
MNNVRTTSPRMISLKHLIQESRTHRFRIDNYSLVIIGLGVLGFVWNQIDFSRIGRSRITGFIDSALAPILERLILE